MNSEGANCQVYDPEAQRWTSYLKLWGTRGSVPVSGPQYSTFGGNTPCLEVRRAGRMVIIDAGTGIRGLGDALMTSNIREVHLFFGHTHWDHIIGFPFFLPLYSPEFTIHIYAEHHKERNIQEALSKVLKPHYFPIRLEEMQAELRYHSLVCGQPIVLGDLEIHTHPCDHPGGALAFRIQTPDHRIGYATDHEFLKGYRGAPKDVDPNSSIVQAYQGIIDFFQHCSPLIHEAQYTPREYRAKIGWGHSSTANATALIKLADIHDWIVTHHDPGADDEILRNRARLHWQVLNDAGIDCHVTLGFDGMALPL